MASKSALLRNIRPSGGLFTENILLRLRDNPERVNIGKIKSFVEEDSKEQGDQFKEKRRTIFDWCIQKWDEISPKIKDTLKEESLEKWSLDDLIQKWLIPFFEQFDYELETFEKNEESIDNDSPLKDFELSFQTKEYLKPFFQFVNIKEDFDSKISNNPQNKSHHNVCQQFINLNPEINWLFLSNGRILRILTKYYHSYSKGYLEFDLENTFANRDEMEFNTLYSIIHSSRFNSKVEDGTLLIDKFQKDSTTEGVKIGDTLRDNVEHALELLGNELIQQNLDKIDLNEIDVNEFYAELLRIIYRIIFILYAEQRDMLPGAGTLYFEQFSLSSLRIRAEKPIKAEKNYDLWNKILITFILVRDGNSLLGVNSYNGSLFKDDNLRIILKNGMKISNDIVLKVIRLLTTSANHKVRQRINFLEVSEEEIGAIYESLLDFKPHISSTSQFQLIEGTERKSTGSYYTPKALIDILIRTTLQRLVEERLIKAGDDEHARESAILDLKVCDPACGGGTFLLSALDYLGKKLAEIRTDSDSPLEDDMRKARRDVLQHCIYGVDMNVLAVELAKISLWLRACVKDKPLNFLDNHIKCGNSLIGLGQKIEINNINPNAFEAISGNKATGIPSENKKLRSTAREVIKREVKQRKMKGKTTLITSFFTDRRTADICSVKFKEIIDMPETDPNKIKKKEQKYKEIRRNENYQQALNEADIWTSTFFWLFEGDTLGELPRYTTIEQLKDKITDPELSNLMKKIKTIAKENQFFHWFIEFPEVFSAERGGFDCILTNPPWETLQLKENEFFAGLDNEILSAPNQSKRRKLIHDLKNKNNKMFRKYKTAWMNLKKMSHYLRTSNLYDLTAKGTINSYALFTERTWNLISPTGYVGIITPTGVIMNYFMQDLFKTLISHNSLASMFDFSNRKKIFDIDSHFRFCLLSLNGKNLSQEIIPMTFYTLEPQEIQEPLSLIFDNQQKLESLFRLPDDQILIPLERKDFELFNPNTLTCPSFHIKRDARLLRHLYKQTSILIENNSKISNNPWSISFKRMFDTAGDSKLFLTQEELKTLGIYPKFEESIGGKWINNEGENFLPLYSGKMLWNYDHRYQSEIIDTERKQRSLKPIKNTIRQHSDNNFYTFPAYWVKEEDVESRIPPNYRREWFLAFRSIVSTDNRRTFISAIIPKTGTLDTISLIFSDLPAKDMCLLLANLNSIIFDYMVRLKISGMHISFYILEQIPIFKPQEYNEKLKTLICKYVLKLTFTSKDLNCFAKDLGFEGETINWDIESRYKIQAELDAIYALLYKINKKDLIYILETFSILKRKEIEREKEFRTKRLILEAYDKLSKQKELFE